MKICIIGAMDIEVNSLIKNLNLVNDGKDIYIGKYNDKDIIVSKSGIGKVNSSCNTQYIIDKYKPDYVISTGCAGSLTNEVNLMDTIVSSYVTYHDFNPERIMRESTPDNGNIKASEYLIEIVRNVIEKEGGTCYVAPIATGDAFVTNEEERDRIRNSTNAYAVDMESASIAHVCKLNDVPFVSVRTISDFSDGVDDDEEEASLRSSEIVKMFLDKIK